MHGLPVYGTRGRQTGWQYRRALFNRHTEVAVSRQMFAEILSLIARLRAPPALA